MTPERNYTLPGGLKAHRCQPAIGAEVSGVDLTRPLSEAHAADLREALFAHGVIFLLPAQEKDRKSTRLNSSHSS